VVEWVYNLVEVWELPRQELVSEWSEEDSVVEKGDEKEVGMDCS